MVAQIRYPGSTTWVNYIINSTALRGNDEIRILEGNTGTIWGIGGNDTIWGSQGADDVYGGIGNDYLSGAAGNDTLYGEEGTDIIYGGDGNDRILGGDGADQLYGQNGVDTIYGGIGNDNINGGQSRDNLYGDGGNDTFIFNHAMTGWDMANDSAGDDTYRFEGAAKAEIFDAAGSDAISFYGASFSSLDAIQVGNDVWVASATDISTAVESGMTLSASTVYSGAWIHDGMTTGKIETVYASDMSGNIDLLLA